MQFSLLIAEKMPLKGQVLIMDKKASQTPLTGSTLPYMKTLELNGTFKEEHIGQIVQFINKECCPKDGEFDYLLALSIGDNAPRPYATYTRLLRTLKMLGIHDNRIQIVDPNSFSVDNYAHLVSRERLSRRLKAYIRRTRVSYLLLNMKHDTSSPCLRCNKSEHEMTTRMKHLSL